MKLIMGNHVFNNAIQVDKMDGLKVALVISNQDVETFGARSLTVCYTCNRQYVTTSVTFIVPLRAIH